MNADIDAVANIQWEATANGPFSRALCFGRMRILVRAIRVLTVAKDF